jgi:hypothetical protein
VTVTLLDFDHDDDFASWYPVDDVVMGGISRSAFERAAPAGRWCDVRLPVDGFAPTFRGRRVPFAPALDAAKVRALGPMLSDRQAGTFELLVDRIAIGR